MLSADGAQDAVNPFLDPSFERDQVFVDELTCIGMQEAGVGGMSSKGRVDAFQVGLDSRLGSNSMDVTAGGDRWNLGLKTERSALVAVFSPTWAWTAKQSYSCLCSLVHCVPWA